MIALIVIPLFVAALWVLGAVFGVLGWCMDNLPHMGDRFWKKIGL